MITPLSLTPLESPNNYVYATLRSARVTMRQVLLSTYPSELTASRSVSLL